MKYKIPKKQKGGSLLKENNSLDPIYEGGMIPAAVSSYKYTMKDYDNLASKKNLNQVPSVLQSGVMKAKVRGAINKGVKDVLLPTIGVAAAPIISAPIISSAIASPSAFIGGIIGGASGQVATDKIVQKASKNKYSGWGDMVSKKTSIPPIVSEFTNPGALVGGFIGASIRKTAGSLVNKKAINRFIDYKLKPERPLTEAEVRLKNIKLNKAGILSEQKTINWPWKEPIRKGIEPFGYGIKHELPTNFVDDIPDHNVVTGNRIKDIMAPIFGGKNKTYRSEVQWKSYNLPFERPEIVKTKSAKEALNIRFKNNRSIELKNYPESTSMKTKNRYSTWDMYLGKPQSDHPLYKVSPFSTTKNTVYTIKPEHTDRTLVNIELWDNIKLAANRDKKDYIDVWNKVTNNGTKDYIVRDWDRYFGTMGGFHWKITPKENGNIQAVANDIWDLHPFQKNNFTKWPKLNKLIGKQEVGKWLGVGKPLNVKVGFEFNKNGEIVNQFEEGGTIK